MWGNPAQDYASARAALAIEVGRAAGIQAGDSVLSLACAAGDELQCWVQHFGAAQALGVDADTSRVAQGNARSKDRRIELRHASFAQLDSLGLRAASFDRVLCIDAAYHLRPRADFLRSAMALLRPGGRLAYTDLSLEPRTGRWRAPLLRAAAGLCGLDAAELLPLSAQRQRLEGLGWQDVRVQPLVEAVLDGFASFVRRQGDVAGAGPWAQGSLRPWLTARLIAPCRSAGLGYALLAASRDA